MTKTIQTSLIIFLLSMPWIPAQAADFQWMDDQGAMHSTAEMKGKPFILHLWASWCPPCQAELPEFSHWVSQHPDITIIPVSLDRSIDEAAAFISAQKLNIPALLTDPGQAQKLGVRGLPTTLVFAADGSIRQRHLGPRQWQSLAFNQQLAKALHP